MGGKQRGRIVVDGRHARPSRNRACKEGSGDSGALRLRIEDEPRHAAVFNREPCGFQADGGHPAGDRFVNHALDEPETTSCSGRQELSADCLRRRARTVLAGRPHDVAGAVRARRGIEREKPERVAQLQKLAEHLQVAVGNRTVVRDCREVVRGSSDRASTPVSGALLTAPPAL